MTVIDTIVKYSKDCITMRFSKEHLKKSQLLIRRFPSAFTIPSAPTINTILHEVEMRINEREQDIRKLLEPLFEGHDFGYDTKFSLSVEDIRSGYIYLVEKNGDDHVILLRPYKNLSTKTIYTSGVLYKVVDKVIDEKLLISIYDRKQVGVGHDLVDIIIKKNKAYEYIEQFRDK